MNSSSPYKIKSHIWYEEAEPDNPYVAQSSYCHGYDVYGEMVGNARWVEMLYLLFKGEAPTHMQANRLEALAVALANPGPREASVHAAMAGGVGGSTAASCLMAALAVGAGQLSGGREIFLLMQAWQTCGFNINQWRDWLQAPTSIPGSVWPTAEHPLGFDPHGIRTSTPVKQLLAQLLAKGQTNNKLTSHEPVTIKTTSQTDSCLGWLEANREALEADAESPLALSGVAAAAFVDLGFKPEQGEMLYLLLRLPGAAAHALEQQEYGHKSFPFGDVILEENLDHNKK
ncbi:MAG: citryl-CoA lyase [Pseudomonadota bacterium]